MTCATDVISPKAFEANYVKSDEARAIVSATIMYPKNATFGVT